MLLSPAIADTCKPEGRDLLRALGGGLDVLSLRNVFYPQAGAAARLIQCEPSPAQSYRAALARSSPAVQSAARQFSYHEAGHALCCLLDGQGVSRVWLEVREQADGTLDIPGARVETPGRFTATALAAGFAAERIAGFTFSAARMEASEDAALFNALRHAGTTPIATFDEALQVAERRCRAYWPSVAALAEELYASGFVSGADAEAILRAELRGAA